MARPALKLDDKDERFVATLTKYGVSAADIARELDLDPKTLHHTDRCLLQRHVQSNIVHHCCSPSLRGHIRMASCALGELIPCAFVWHDPGITPCCKTILPVGARKIDSRFRRQCATLIQESVRHDSIIAYFYSTGSSR